MLVIAGKYSLGGALHCTVGCYKPGGAIGNYFFCTALEAVQVLRQYEDNLYFLIV